jgi:hypothetical protein
MSRRHLLALLVLAVTCLTLGPERTALAAPSPPPGTQAILRKMIEAVKAQSYDDFVVEADARLKSQLTRQQFEGICGLYTEPLRKGYRLEYLGLLRQQGTTVLLWKITVVDSPDETLLRMVMKDGKVDGFSVH